MNFFVDIYKAKETCKWKDLGKIELQVHFLSSMFEHYYKQSIIVLLKLDEII